MVMCTKTTFYQVLGICVVPVLYRQMQFEITVLHTLNSHHILPSIQGILGKYSVEMQSNAILGLSFGRVKGVDVQFYIRPENC